MKRIFFGIIFIVLIMATSRTPQAKVTGVCSGCHTMHNSQAGDYMAYSLKADFSGFDKDATPNPSLLMYSCVGCHTNVTNADTTVNNVPIVFNPGGTITDPLAAGNFYYVVNDGDDKGHNVVDIKGSDGTLGNTPPGGTVLSSQLTCAGQYGCHGDTTAGNDELAGIKTAHHTNDTGGITGDPVGLSYRFLDGILGTEDDDWEQDNDNTSHNEYKGAASPGTDTISSLCAKCHGDFHSPTGVGSSSPWLRHPTDRVLKGSGEYANYTTYSMTAPVARPDLAALPETPDIVRPGTDVIMCLSCHRAHGSPNYKMIRWNYRGDGDATLTEQLEGCIVCHISKS